MLKEEETGDFLQQESTSQSSSSVSSLDSPPPIPSLPTPLRLLFGLNGVSLSLPSMALVYIVNTRAAIPVAYLSAYGALAFLPWSFKPLYAYLTQRYFQGKTGTLLVGLLILSGLAVAATALVPPRGIAICFILGFLRGFASAWPEFLLGLALVSHASLEENYKVAAAILQSQAATARNLGSFLANIASFALFAQRHYSNTDGSTAELSDGMVTLLLISTASLNFLAAGIAFCSHVSIHFESKRCTIYEQQQDSPAPLSSFRGNCLLVVIFQLAIILLAMRGPITSVLPLLVWAVLLAMLVAALGIVLYRHPISWQATHRTGVFLILRHALPTSSYLVTSYIYERLQSTPVMLQALSMVSMAVTTLSSASFAKWLAPMENLVLVIVGTTVVSSLVSLTNLLLVFEENRDEWHFFWLAILTGAVTTFFGEWGFLPDVVLATASVDVPKLQEQETLSSIELTHDDVERTKGSTTTLTRQQYQQVAQSDEAHPGESITRCSVEMDTTGMQYGTLIACIDFGDQIGSWVTVPLVAALGITRDNDWANLSSIIILTAALQCLSASLVCILKRD